MKDLIKIAQNAPDRERLETAIIDLLHFINAGAIYVSYNNITNVVVITSVLRKNCDQDGDTLGNTLDKLIKLYPDFIFKFINYSWASYGFKKGKPYFIQHCTLKELVYFEPNAKVFYPYKNTSKVLVQKAKKRFNTDFEAATVSLRNVSIFARNQKSVEAAFALHQTLRYIYICASEFMSPEFISSTCLLIHYDYINDFAPTFKNILNKESQEDKEILMMLNAAYNCIVHNKSISNVDNAMLATAKAKIELMQRELKRLFAEYVELCKEKVRELNRQKFLGRAIFNHKISPNYIIDNALDEVSTVLAECFKIRSVYCFGYNTFHNENKKTKKESYSKKVPNYHFYLLVVYLEHTEKAILLMQNLIQAKFGKKYKVTILYHNSNFVRKKNQNQKYFFDAIITNGLLVYNNPLYLAYPETNIGERDLNFCKKYVEHRILIAQQLFSLAQNCFSDDSIIIKKVLFRKVIEQIAIGLIYLFLSYHAGKFSINYLFSLLKYIDEVDFPFDCDNGKESTLYQYLIETTEVSIKKKKVNGNILDNKFLENKCIAFFKQAKELSANAFEKLENTGK
ncbi:hypothetical protein [Flavobacterium hibernum]|uniref:HEPN domain-containing protein n=1 Tax=Flavobacterium hibernum TaxID=37752 RepID=A0A0D0EES4_9FLAO|nr:hypothetical protein [Flavobacterium hibernum]KIO52859.1 hypothetical protein IW18_09980 [Flavobacterium hibernum]OXA88499.1 hypothetical protein B0A73_07390 [Flavobacterium hibernum]STO15374.1 Uncharacterised protein [Flavobacterium hibernum]